MKRWGLLVVMLFALVVASNNAPAEGKAPGRYPLGGEKAAALMGEALGREFEGAFENSYSKSVRCNTRLSRDRRRCNMSWVIGDTGFSGRGTIWITYPEGQPFWNYAFRIAVLDEYCASTGGDHCLTWRVVR